MKPENYKIFLQGKIVAICEAIVKEEIGIIAGSRKLQSIGYELFDNRDENFIIFTVVDSETDHLPVDFERKNWSADSLYRKDKEIAEYEMQLRDEVIAVCNCLIERFNFKL